MEVILLDRTQQTIYRFLSRFVRHLGISAGRGIGASDIGYSQKPSTTVYVRKETWDEKTDGSIELYVDCLDRRGSDFARIPRRYCHVTWAALTYYARGCSWKLLLRPLGALGPPPGPRRKPRFCDFMFFNRTYRNGVRRYAFYQLLDARKHVHHVRTDKRFTVDMFRDATEQHRPYRFSIAFENDVVDGWVTEKIVSSFLAGCIPIYEGTADVYKYFNREAFIDASDFDSLDALADYVLLVDSDPALYQKYMDARPSSLEKLQRLFWWESLA